MKVWKGRAKNGKVVWKDPDGIKKRMQELDDRDLVITIEPGRSLSANAYFHAAILPAFIERTGYEEKEAKKLLKDMHNDGRDTRDLSESEMAEFNARCIRWLAIELEVVVEDPR